MTVPSSSGHPSSPLYLPLGSILGIRILGSIQAWGLAGHVAWRALEIHRYSRGIGYTWAKVPVIDLEGLSKIVILGYQCCHNICKASIKLLVDSITIKYQVKCANVAQIAIIWEDESRYNNYVRTLLAKDLHAFKKPYAPIRPRYRHPC